MNAIVGWGKGPWALVTPLETTRVGVMDYEKDSFGMLRWEKYAASMNLALMCAVLL